MHAQDNIIHKGACLQNPLLHDCEYPILAWYSVDPVTGMVTVSLCNGTINEYLMCPTALFIAKETRVAGITAYK